MSIDFNTAAYSLHLQAYNLNLLITALFWHIGVKDVLFQRNPTVVLKTPTKFSISKKQVFYSLKDAGLDLWVSFRFCGASGIFSFLWDRVGIEHENTAAR